jgi:CheY-like chemotaxis protein
MGAAVDSRRLRVSLAAGSEVVRSAVAAACDALGWTLADDGTEGDVDLVLVDLPSATRANAEAILSLKGDGEPRVVALGTLASIAALTPAESEVFDGSVVKPFTTAALLAAALPEGVPAARPAAARGPRLNGVRVLIVEDNDVSRAVATEMLEAEGASVQFARNGREGVDAVTVWEGGLDVVLMDQQMPVLDGLAATREIRAAGHTVPMLAITANAMSGDRMACLAAGMDGFIAKPFDLDELVETILLWIGRYSIHVEEDLADEEPSASADRAVPPPVAAHHSEWAPAEAQPAGQADHAVAHEPEVEAPEDLDHVVGLARVAGHTDFYAGMLEKFVAGLPHRLDEVDVAAGEGDTEGAARHAHALAGAALMLGATRMGAAARELEYVAKEGTTLVGAAELDELHLAAAGLESAVRQWRATAFG